ncbi:MAG: hypothetical protein QM572_11930 [Nocardioides sp.]|uniref:hypothetical protein n=1 Tax=Nocardioides sp. TaxID=35761 RepID=UPI0039E58266
MSALEVAGELYGLTPAEFTPARNAAVTRLKGTPDAVIVKRLRKPSMAAWVVNLLVRHETEQIEQMLDVGAALRAAQADLDAAQLRALTTQRRQLTAAMTTRGRALSGEHGVRVTEGVAEQVLQTLNAAMIDEGAAGAVRSGLLVGTLMATGVGPVEVTESVALPEVIGHASPPSPTGLRAVKNAPNDAESTRAPARERAERRRAAREMLAQAEDVADAAQAELARSAAQLRCREAASMQAHAELEELQRRVADAEVAVRDAEDRLSDTEQEHETAQTQLAEARDAVNEARRSLAELD